MDFNVSFLRKDEKNVMHQMRTKTGTVAFSAPEIFTQNVYDEKVDIWSAGIVLYMMLSGKQPYESERMARLVEMITTLEKPPFMEQDLAQVSDDAKDLIEQMLKKDPASRPTASLVLQHLWLADQRLSTNGSAALTGAADNLGQRRISKIDGLLSLGEKMSVRELINELLAQGLDKQYNLSYGNCHHSIGHGHGCNLGIKHAHSQYE